MSKQIYIEHADADYDYAGEYINQCCICDKKYTLFTQLDEKPEYRTNVSVMCDCGGHVDFLLPVN